jgi:hypothetical protein
MAWTKAGPGRPGPPKTSELQLIRAKEFARLIVDDPEYRRNLYNRAIKGDLAPAVEILLLHYRFGKPTDELTVTHKLPTDAQLSELTPEQLAARAERLAVFLRSIPPEPEQLPAPSEEPAEPLPDIEVTPEAVH